MEAEMKFMRRKAAYILLDRRINRDILQLKVDPVGKELAQYEQKW